MLVNIFDHLLLILGFVVGFFLPGFLIIEHFFRFLPRIQKIFLYGIVSVLFSAFVIYLFSLLLGYSRLTIIFVYLNLVVLTLISILCQKYKKYKSGGKHLASYLIGIFIYVAFLLVLSRSVFRISDNVVILAGDSWQDTALHLSIIESLSQGNFPPQAPYFSGRPLSYYYFADFHSSIIETLYNHFFPRVVVYTNPVFATLLFSGVYSLAYYLTRSRLSSIFSGILGVFGGNFMFITFFKDLISTNNYTFLSFANLLASKTYAAEYPKLIQVTPIVNLIIQNRPMAVALPAFIGVILILLVNNKKLYYRNFIILGFISAILIYFQTFSFAVCLLAGIIYIIFNIREYGLEKSIFSLLFFMAPVILVLFFRFVFSTEDNNLIISSFQKNFRLGPWDSLKEFSWYIKFALLNFGVFIFTTIITPFITIFVNIPKTTKKSILFIWFLSIILYLVPHFVTFTIYQIDMFKFFYFYMLLSSVLFGFLVSFIKPKKFLVIIITIVVLSCLTSVLDLFTNIFNQNYGYTKADLAAGLWIRDNTESKSVFVTSDTIHSPVTDIGGRLRILSYGNWPYTHGFDDKTDDDVSSRYRDVDNFYNNFENKGIASWILSKYNIDYVYYGPTENDKYPDFENKFTDEVILEKVYDKENIKIYKRN